MTFFLNWTASPYLYGQHRGMQQAHLKTVSSRPLDSQTSNKGEETNSGDQSFDAVLNEQMTATEKKQMSLDDAALQAFSTEKDSGSQTGSSVSGSLEYTIQSGDTLWDLAVHKYHVNVEDLIKDNGVQDPRKLQPGQKIKIRLPDYQDETKKVTASWYGADYHGKPMANGEPYDMYAATIAHRDLPLGTMVELSNPETGQKVVAKVTDRGPFIQGRDVDLSFNLAQRLSMVEKGVGTILMKVLG